jgi:hypothetical protein
LAGRFGGERERERDWGEPIKQENLKLYLSLEKGDYESKRTKWWSGFFFFFFFFFFTKN